MSPPSLTIPEELGTTNASREVVVGQRTDGGDPRPTILRWFETWATGRTDRRRG